MKTVYFLSFLFLFSINSFATDVKFECESEKEFNLVFINGILNTLPEAEDGKERLKIRVKELNEGKNSHDYLFYNPTEGALIDLIESKLQIEREYGFYSKGLTKFAANSWNYLVERHLAAALKSWMVSQEGLFQTMSL